MGFVLNFLVLSLVLVSAYSHFNSSEEGFISMVISQKGLNFIKDLLIEKGISTIIPLRLPNIEKTNYVILVGKVHTVISNIIIEKIDVNSSDILIDERGVKVVVTKATASIGMKWRYTYDSWLIEISDKGDAFVQADGLNIGLTLGLNEQNGTLQLSLLDCDCSVEDLSIDLHGGASWLYQVMVDVFQGLIVSNIEDNICKKIEEGIVKLDSLLLSLPHAIPIADVAAFNLTLVGKPVLYHSSIEFKINGLFIPINKNLVSGYYYGETEDSVYGKDSIEYYHDQTEDVARCKDSVRMFEISVHENVINSASLVLFKENYMHCIVDQVPDQYLLNTAAWKWIIPQLYNQYPDDDMILNISASVPPFVKLQDQDIYTTINVDVIVDVIDFDEVVPVACISSEVTAFFSPNISENNLVGHVSLEDFSLTLKWSKIGRIHLFLLQETIEILIRTTLIPFVNLYLAIGVPLPSFNGLTLPNGEVFFNNSRIIMCTDVALGQ